MSSFINKMVHTPMLQNKFVLYASLFVVLLSILRHISNNNINAVVLMALIGLVTSYFSKNMIIILLTAFSTVFVLEMLGSRGVTEGMKNEKDEKDEDDETENYSEFDSETKSKDPPPPPADSDKDKSKKEKKEEEGIKNMVHKDINIIIEPIIIKPKNRVIKTPEAFRFFNFKKNLSIWDTNLFILN